jgi:hypothetical protein
VVSCSLPLIDHTGRISTRSIPKTVDGAADSFCAENPL